MAARPPVPAEDARWRVIARTAFPFVVVGVIWEIVAHLGVFPPRLFPPLEEVAAAFWRLTVAGILPHHAIADDPPPARPGLRSPPSSASRSASPWGARAGPRTFSCRWSSIGAPIPGIAYAPLFLLWFGLGNVPAVLLVAFVSAFPIIFNTWTGVKAVKEIWVRSAQAMGADDRRLFRHVILPGALPYILTGLRLGLAQAWRILVGVEMLAAVPWGLGWLIFGAREFLNTDVMLAGVAVIGIIGLALEKLVFQRLEDYTVVRWGMMTMTATGERIRIGAPRRAVTLLVAAALYEVDRAQRLFPGRAAADAARSRRARWSTVAARRHHAAPRAPHALPRAVRLRRSPSWSACRSAS